MAKTPKSAGKATLKSVVAQIDDLFAPWNRTDIPGAIVGVVKDGKRMYRRAFGMASIELAVANTRRTRMRIGSISKHFTCLLALLLQEDGKLDVNAPIRSYVPELIGPGGDPTLLQLMLHRGGSRCYLDLTMVITHGLTAPTEPVELDLQARQRGRNFAPGEAMIYNNGGYHMLSLAIERVGGKPFEEQLHEKLFAPLSMSDTASVPSDYAIVPGVAAMHLQLPDGVWRRGLFPSTHLRGEGAIVSTVDDMLKWTSHLRSRDRFGVPETWDAFTKLVPYPSGEVGAYACGVILASYRGAPTIRHSGGVIGGTAQMLIFPDHGLDIIIIANGAPELDVGKAAEKIADIILTDQLGKPNPTIRTVEYEGLTGDWLSTETGMIYSLIDHDGELQATVCKLDYGANVIRSADGRTLAPETSSGSIEFGLDAARAGGPLAITSAGKTAMYTQFSGDILDTAAFAKAACGTYESQDANSTATIEAEDGKLFVQMGERYWGLRAELHPITELAAYTKATPIAFIGSWALTFAMRDGVMSGFRLNSARTRDLEFVRL